MSVEEKDSQEAGDTFIVVVVISSSSSSTESQAEEIRDNSILQRKGDRQARGKERGGIVFTSHLFLLLSLTQCVFSVPLLQPQQQQMIIFDILYYLTKPINMVSATTIYPGIRKESGKAS